MPFRRCLISKLSVSSWTWSRSPATAKCSSAASSCEDVDLFCSSLLKLQTGEDTVIVSGEPAVLTSNMDDVDSPEIFVKLTEAGVSVDLIDITVKTSDQTALSGIILSTGMPKRPTKTN